MAVVSANKMWSNHSFDVEQSDNFDKEATIVQAWQIVVEPGTTEVEISQSSSIPFTGAIFSGDLPYLFLRNRSFKQESPVLWTGTMTYKGKIGLNGPAPWQNPPRISWSDSSNERIVQFDINGKAITNVLGEPLKASMEVADLVLSVQRNYQSFSPAATFQYRHSVNSDSFLGFSAGTGRLTGFTASQEWDDNAGGYWKVDAEITFRYPYNTTFQRAWWARVLNEGRKERRRDGRVINAIDGNLDPVSSPIMLDGDGYQIVNPDNATYVEAELYQALPYNALGLL